MVDKFGKFKWATPIFLKIIEAATPHFGGWGLLRPVDVCAGLRWRPLGPPAKQGVARQFLGVAGRRPYYNMLGWITEDQSQGQRGHLLYSLGLSGRAYGVSHHSYIKWCHNGVILHHNSSIEYFHSFYVPITSCMHCYNQLLHVSTYFEIEWLGNNSHRLYKWNFLRLL